MVEWEGLRTGFKIQTMRQILKESRRAQQPKYWDYNNQDETDLNTGNYGVQVANLSRESQGST